MSDLPGFIMLHPNDNVRVAIESGDQRGHKFAARAIRRGEAVVKLGEQIGAAASDIKAGEHVHTHNVHPARVVATAQDAGTRVSPVPEQPAREFLGFHRHSGSVGTRNHVLVLTTVNCSASVARVVARRAREAGIERGVDSITALTHHGGCALGQDSDGLANLQRTLAGYATHVNVGGALIIGLGCESNQLDQLAERHGLKAEGRVRTLVIQEEGGSAATIELGVEIVGELVEQARTDVRTAAPVAGLCLGLQCGGSDGFSAISANPALGRAADILVGHGGTVLLGETPEMHGAEHLLVRRAVDADIAQKLLDRLAWWRSHSEPENNPSPGNKRGGLTTIAEKSLGAVAKAGTSPLVDVLRYADPVSIPGFVVMDSPGYDPCSVTGEIASGATVLAFTTGRGSVSGFVPAPSLKISTNTDLFQAMPGDIDIDAGTVVSQEETVDEVGERIFDAIVATASGSPTVSETMGFGEEEFVPWQMGVVT